MAIKLHRCSNQWVKIQAHPCWKIEKALLDMGIEYERVPGPRKKDEREAVIAGTGQKLYPAIQFENGDVVSRAVQRHGQDDSRRPPDGPRRLRLN